MAPAQKGHEVTRCWALWCFCYWDLEDNTLESDRVVACQLEAGHRAEHESHTELGDFWWNKESQCGR